MMFSSIGDTGDSEEKSEFFQLAPIQCLKLCFPLDRDLFAE